MKWRHGVVPGLVFLVAAFGVWADESPTPSVLVGRIRAVVNDRPPLKMEPVRSFVVFEVKRVLAGDESTIGHAVLIYMATGPDGRGTKILSPTEQVLDPSTWRHGRDVVIVAKSFDPRTSPVSCLPVLAALVRDGEDELAEPLDRAPWRNAELQALRPIDLYCANMEDAFLVAP